MRRRIGIWMVFAAVILAAGVAVAVRNGSRPDPRALRAEIHRAAAAARWDRAGVLLDRLAEVQAPDTEATLLRAEVANGQGRPDDALALLDALPDHAPGAARARLYAAQLERNRHRIRRAEARLLDAVALEPGLPQARRELIYLYGMQARREELAAQFRALAELGPLDQNELMMWTASHEDIWVNDSIEDDLQRFLDADPEDRQSRLALAEVHLRDGRLDACEAVLKPLPNSDVEALALRAQVAMDRADLDAARALLAEGPRAHARLARLARLRGRLAVRDRDPAAAVAAYQIAVELAPTNREGLQGLALALTLAGDEQSAAEYTRRAGALREVADLLDRVRALDGQVDRALPARLGAACEAAGQRDEARAWYRLAVTLNPLDADAQQALYRLREP